ncbi:ribonucleotide reductase [Cutibacterium acnes JCM 18909]|nr:ribonucleotide reductase [Cutibacterium acnes JCM 18909]
MAAVEQGKPFGLMSRTEPDKVLDTVDAKELFWQDCSGCLGVRRSRLAI